MKDFIKYSHKNIHFYDFGVPIIVEKLLREMNNKRINFCDLGCGDGSLLFAISQKNLLENADTIVGVDISNERIQRLRRLNINNLLCIVSDACHIKSIENNIFDIVASTQLIEHVKDDRIFLNEIARILKTNSYLYISSVIKKNYGFWIYRNNNKFVLDPTHVREYSSREEFTNLLKSCNLYPIQIKMTPCRFIILDGLIRFGIMLNIFSESNQNFFIKYEFLNILRRLKIPVPGYYIIECLCINKKR